MKLYFISLFALFLFGIAGAQNCKNTAELDLIPGQYLTAAQHPWPGARADYFRNLATPADKALAKKTLEQVEKIEQQSRTGFNLTGGNWESTFSSNDYEFAGNAKLGKYYLQLGHYEFFCTTGKMKRSSEYSTVLRVHVNSLSINTLDKFLRTPFSGRFGNYDLGFGYADLKNHKTSRPGDKLINLFTYFSCANSELLEAINGGKDYFQDVPEKDVKLNTRVPHIYRYWYVKKNDQPLLAPVSRKEYLLSLLEYYEREKLHFPKLIAKLKADRDNSVKHYDGWETTVNEKIELVKKELSIQTEDWLSKPAVINRLEDASQNYKSQLKERINYNRFWRFYDNEKKSEPLYKYNEDYFKNTIAGPVKAQFITVVFRYVTIPSSLRLLNNFTGKFDSGAYKKLLQ